MRTRTKRRCKAPNRWHRRAFLNPRAEFLEQRLVLSAATTAYELAAPQWFAEVAQSYESEPPRMIAAASVDFVGPMPSDDRPVSRWIVELTPAATGLSDGVAGTIELLQFEDVDLRLLRGLGSPGALLVEGKGSSVAIAGVLSENSHIASFELDTTVEAQREPDDPEFVAGSMIGLNNTGQFGASAGADIDAPEAWNETIGSPSVVVGVIDSGIDATHPDLYLNIWINQGEISETVKSQLTDVDTDGLFRSYDLNNCTTAPVVVCNWTTGPNAALLTDFNGTHSSTPTICSQILAGRTDAIPTATASSTISSAGTFAVAATSRSHPTIPAMCWGMARTFRARSARSATTVAA